MKQIFCVLITVLTFPSLLGQQLKPSEIEMMKSFGINEVNMAWQDHLNRNKLQEIIKKERKRKKSKTLGYISGGLGLLTMTGGILIISQNTRSNNPSQPNESGAYADTIGGVVLAAGIIEMGVSIPFFISSSKRRKERDELLLKLNIQNGF